MQDDTLEPGQEPGDFPGTAEQQEARGKSLIDAAKEAGGQEIITRESIGKGEKGKDAELDDAFNSAPTTQDIIGTGKISFYPDLPQVEFKYLVGQQFLVYNILMVENWDGYFGTSTFGLIRIMMRDGRKATSLAGGLAIIKQLRGFLAKKRFPVKVELTEKPGQQGNYYLLI